MGRIRYKMENLFEGIEFLLDEKGNIHHKEYIEKGAINILQLYKYERQIHL